MSRATALEVIDRAHDLVWHFESEYEDEEVRDAMDEALDALRVAREKLCGEVCA